MEPNVADLRYIKLWILLDQIIWVWNIIGLHIEILMFKYLILLQRLNSFRENFALTISRNFFFANRLKQNFAKFSNISQAHKIWKNGKFTQNDFPFSLESGNPIYRDPFHWTSPRTPPPRFSLENSRFSLETQDFFLETTRILTPRLETLNFSLEIHIYWRPPQICVKDPKKFIKDPK